VPSFSVTVSSSDSLGLNLKLLGVMEYRSLLPGRTSPSTVALRLLVMRMVCCCAYKENSAAAEGCRANAMSIFGCCLATTNFVEIYLLCGIAQR
jgi:hypothetical protein